MVTTVTNFARSGVADWLVLRVTSVILFAYFVFIGYVLATGVDYAGWSALFDQTWMKIFSFLALLSIGAHSWIGIWAVLTDYVTERLLGPKGNVLRILLQLCASLALVVYVIWGVLVLWG